jgi:hypothetical protein
MAKTVIDTLVTNLSADGRQMRSELSRSEKDTSAWGGRMKGIIGGVVGAFSISRIIGGIAAATAKQEEAVAQLQQGLITTNGAVGQSLDTLIAKAGELQKVTTFGDEEFIETQARLVTFTKIMGEEFDRTIELSADLATRFKTSLPDAAMQLGKALNDPVANLGALSRAGIQFSKDQKEVIKTLFESGRESEAQKIILAELETQFGGSARAARDTFGGALKSLKNASADLLESEGGLNDAKEQIEELTEILQDPATVEGVNKLTSALLRLTGGAVNAGVELANFGDQIAINAAALTGNLSEFDRLEQEIKDVDRALKGGFNTPIKFLFTSDEELEKLKERMVKERELLTGIKAESAAPVKQSGSAVTKGGISPGAVAEDEAKALQLLNEQQKLAAALFKDTRTAAENYNAKLKEYDDLLSAGVITQQTYNRAVADARETFEQSSPALQRQLDLNKEFATVQDFLKTDIERVNEAYDRRIEVVEKSVISEQQSKALIAELNEKRQQELTLIRESTDEHQKLLEIQQEFRGVQEFLKSDIERVNEAYDRRIEVVRASVEEEAKAAEIITELNAKRNEELKALADQQPAGFDAIFGAGALEKLFSDFENIESNFKGLIIRMVAEAAQAQILQGLGMGTGGMKSFTDIGGIIGGAFGGIFGGARADGGPVSPDKTFLVGERGPELFVPKTAGRIVPNHEMVGGGVTVNMNVSANDPARFKKATRQLQYETQLAIQGARS